MINLKGFKRWVVLGGAYVIPKSLALLIAKFFLHTTGIGYAVEVNDSGEIRLLRKIFNRQKDFILFDIGGNVGMYSHLVCQEFPNSEVHVFEPSKKHFQLLVDRLRPHSLRCHLNNFGLGERDETSTLYKDKEITGSATLLNKTKLLEMNIKESVEIRDIRSYLLANKISFIDFVKIDVEGWEYPIISTLSGLIENSTISYVQFEVTSNTIENGYSIKDFFSIFQRCNYRLFIVSPCGSLNPALASDDASKIYLSTNYLAVSPKVRMASYNSWGK
jgi:FkbM family methyltransferase